MNYILYEISNFYDIKTKRSFDKIKFIENYYGLLLEKYNIDNVELYIDEDLLNKSNSIEKDIYAYHYCKKIYIHDKFFKTESNFFYDLHILTHEFMHFVEHVRQENSIKKIGEKPFRFKLGFDHDILLKMGITQKSDINAIYTTNESEVFAEMQSYDFVLDLIEKAQKQISQNTIEYQLLKINFAKVKNLRLYKEVQISEYNSSRIPEIIKTAKDKQEEWFQFFIYRLEELPYLPDDEQLDEMTIVINLLHNILYSFAVYENFEILNKIKNYCIENAEEQIYCLPLYYKCLNYPNYTITKEDITNLIDFCDVNYFNFHFDDLEIEPQNLMQTIAEYKFDEYNKEFEEKVGNFPITNYIQFLKTYNAYILLNQKNKELNNLKYE